MSSVAEQPGYPEWDRVQRTALWTALSGVIAFAAIAGTLSLVGVVQGAQQFFLSYSSHSVSINRIHSKFSFQPSCGHE